jgi:hypothetical protein
MLHGRFDMNDHVDFLSMWRENVDFQLVVSRHVVLKYILKYVSNVEKRSENYYDMLTRITNSSSSEDSSLCAYKIFFV